jgi:hypothetical protein
VSDLYHETSQAGTAEPDTGSEPARDTGSGQQYETVEPTDHSYGEYTETDAEVQARIAEQDKLPAREESRQTTWGDDPDYYDEAELGAEYDGDVDAFLAGQDELPTPQESRARTWGDNPEYYDEADLASEYDGGLGALTTEEDSQAARHAPASPGAEEAHAEPAIAPEETADSHAQSADADNREQDAAGTANDQPTPAGTDLITTEPGQVDERRATADLSTDAQAGLPEGDDGDVLSPEADRLKALETERDADRQEIADLKAELKAVKDEQAVRFDRIEQLLASTDRQPEGTDTSEHGADQPGATPAQDASRAERKETDQGTDTKWAEQARWRRAVSSENAGIASALVGATGTVSEFVMHMTPEGTVGLTATVLGLASLGLAKAEKHRKGKA